MSLLFPYRFALAMFREDDSVIATVPVNRDWEPVHEWTRLYCQRRGLFPLDDNGDASLLPLWDETAGEPYCRGYRIELAWAGGQSIFMDFPRSHFREYAATFASGFVELGRLREGEHYMYAVVAYPVPAAAPQGTGLSLTVTDTSPALPVRYASLKSYVEHATPHGAIDAEDMPVFVSPQVLRDFAAQTRAHAGTETGGILIGMLWQDANEREIFAEITAQIPAEYIEGTSVKLTFTPKTWAAAEAALRLRGGREIYLGFVHSHPVKFWCEAKKCSLDQQRTCKLADFFSSDDEALLRAAFPSAYSVGIVANDIALADLTWSMYGNRQGITSRRSFYVLQEETSGA
jgi:Prokaryotic homologs of the JAB domain